MFDRLGWLVLRLRFVLVVGWLVAAVALRRSWRRRSPRPAPPTRRASCRSDAESLAARQVIAAAFPADCRAVDRR